MPSNPKVSIVIPVYNGADYLREAIDSALAQTYNETEVLVINDGSTDNGATEEIARSYGNKIRYFSKNNGGVASALNLGIKEMTGEYFAWLSHDDLFSANRCEEDIKLIGKHPEIRATFCNIITIDSEGRPIGENKRTIKRVTNPREALLLGGIGMCSVTIHKSCFETVGPFSESNRTTQDTEFILKLSKYFNLLHNKNAVTYSREHPNRGTKKLNKQLKKDRLLLSNFIDKNFTIKDFFPDFDRNKSAKASEGFVWLGDFHRFLGAYDVADKYYKAAIIDWKCIASKAGIKFLLGAKLLGLLKNR